ncbi:hypothetical protein [Salinibacter phage 4_17]
MDGGARVTALYTMTQSIRQSGDGSFRAPASITPHRKSELRPVQVPDLPDPGETALIRTGEGLPAAVHHVRDNAGTTDRPDYRSTVYVHTRRGTEPHTREGAREVFREATAWRPDEKERAHLRQAAEGVKTYSEALQAITVLYHRRSGAEVVTR